MGGDSQKLEEKRTIKVKEIENLEKILLSIRNKAKQIKEISKIRDGKLKNLEGVYYDYFQARKKKCEYFEKVSKKKLQITIIESTNKEEFQRCLAFLKRGSYLRDGDIRHLSDKVTPTEFILNLLRYDVSRTGELRMQINILKK